MTPSPSLLPEPGPVDSRESDALKLSSVERWRRALRAFRSMLEDSNRTDQVLEFSAYANAGTMVHRVHLFFDEANGRRLYEERRTLDSKTVDLDALGRLPDGTLGRTYSDFMRERGITPEVFDGAPKQLTDAKVAYVAQRMRQTHDLWHVVTGYETDRDGEILLQAFTYAQLGAPSNLVIAISGTLSNLRQRPTFARGTIAAYLAGRRARGLPAFLWEDQWETPLSTVCERLGIRGPAVGMASPTTKTSMLTESPYTESGRVVPAPLTDVACPYAPQSGLHLYHFPSSLCSQKVRQVLEEKHLQWESHVLLLNLFEQYDPSYVRINPRCVVPTLVRDGRVTTDSANILRFVERVFADGPSLVPTDPTEKQHMEDFLKKADGLFIEALTYGEIPGVQKPWLMRLYARDHHDQQAATLASLLKEHQGDAYLKAAYERKLAISHGTRATTYSPKAMAEILAATDQAIEQLEQELAQGSFSNGGWLCSASFSLADIEWGVVLSRLRMIGLAERLWGGRTQVSRYTERLFLRPSFKTAVTAWANPLKYIVGPSLVKRTKKLLATGNSSHAEATADCPNT